MNQFKIIRPYVVCFSAALFFAYELMQFHMMNAISPMLMRDLQISAAGFGNLCATYLLADVIFLLPAGIILDHFSPKKVIMFAMSLCVIGTVGFSFAAGLYTASIAHFLSGIGNAFSLLSCIVLVSRWFSIKRQAFIISIVVTIGMLGGVIAQTPFSMLAEAFSWREALLIDAVFGVVILTIIYFFVCDNPESYQKEDKEQRIPFWIGVKQSIINKQNILCGFYTSFMNMPLMVLGAVWGSLYLTQIYSFSLAEASFIVGMICTGTIIGSPIYGYLSDKTMRRKPWMYLGGIVSLLIVLAIISSRDFSIFELIILFLLLGIFSSSQILGYPIITESNPQNLTGTSMGIAAVIIMGFPMFIQSLSGFLLDLSWNGETLAGTPVYSFQGYITSFLIFPLGFIISLVATIFIKSR